VTGLGAIQPEANATGAVTTVTPDAGGTSNASLVEELFAGRIPGLQVYDGDRVRIRGIAQDAGLGSSDPLVVIDGMPSQLGVLQALRGFRPDQISKIQILKDVSSTAIYGTRGAAGVILVTLKQH
jgi:TonB-dependent SusC/RagA subfamily outer membrane receptor